MLIRAGYCDETTTVLGTKGRCAARRRDGESSRRIRYRRSARERRHRLPGADAIVQGHGPQDLRRVEGKGLDAIYALLGVPTPERAKKAA